MQLYTSAPQEAFEPGLRARLIEALKHPDIVRPLSDRSEKALAVGVHAEPGDSPGRSRQVHRREHLLHTTSDVDGIELPPRPGFCGVPEYAINLAPVLRECVGR